MNFDSYIISDTKTAISLPSECPPPYSDKGLRHKAFTLAETLITLTIIGVIAALTVPTLMSKYQKHTYVVGLKKAYASLSNAVKMLPIVEPSCSDGVYNCLKESDDPRAENATLNGLSISTISKAFKNAEIATTQEKCGKMLNGSSHAARACMITADGMIFSSYSNYGIGTRVNVDINGLKGPNQPGRDIFTFYITHDNKIAAAGSKLHVQYYDSTYYWNYNPASPSCNQAYLDAMKNYSYDSYCTGRVLEEGAMNY